MAPFFCNSWLMKRRSRAYTCSYSHELVARSGLRPSDIIELSAYATPYYFGQHASARIHADDVFDTETDRYRLVAHDHLAYRYEVR